VSLVDAPEEKQEIIIVRRSHGDHDDAHHGGVWKIAFADFMTAMMCFFLVMWLINAANEQTKAAVASYFNPVKLIDRNSSRKGLEDVGDGPNAVGTKSESPDAPKSESGNDGPSTSGPQDDKHSLDKSEKKSFSDESLFADPYAVLAEIAAETGTMQNISATGDGGAQLAGPATGASGGESYRDPFAPQFWQQHVDVPEDAAVSAELNEAFSDPAPAKPEAPEAAPEAEAVKAEAKPGPVAEREATKEATKLESAAQAPAEPGASPAPAEPSPSEAAEAAAEEIRGELAGALKGSPLEAAISVVASDKGVMISVTDQLDQPMFEVGSAVPSRELVLAMEKIAAVVAGRAGAVTINGHTDGRAFRSETYDNWRLSTARAHSAYYMLVRAGLEERRVQEVAGFADRRLKVKDDPLDDSNRRIEILLGTGG
jgi:chemotaxis protein MotB